MFLSNDLKRIKLDIDQINSKLFSIADSLTFFRKKSALDLIGDMYWHILAGTFTFPVQVATKFNIPLVIWGANGWLDQIGQFFL